MKTDLFAHPGRLAVLHNHGNLYYLHSRCYTNILKNKKMEVVFSEVLYIFTQ